jgi:signal transduction histidine kinase
VVVDADPDLLEHALTNILDNAAKYCHPNTIVRCSGGLTGKKRDRFHITTRSRGLAILPGDVLKCANKGWQSEAAKWNNSDGSGIGLWIVDQVMKAHQGQLVVIPTNKDGFTEVKLILPVKGGER